MKRLNNSSFSFKLRTQDIVVHHGESGSFQKERITKNGGWAHDLYDKQTVKVGPNLAAVFYIYI